MNHSTIRTLALLACLAAPCADAATYCASNSAELSAALQASSGNGVSDTIRVNTGVFTSGGAGFIAIMTGSESLTIEGGWTDFFGDCTLLTSDAELTVLDGENQRQSLRVSVNGSGDLTLRNLTFFRGRANAAGVDRGGGLYVYAAGGASSDVLVERNVFRQSFASSIGGGAHVASDGGIVTVRNNLFRVNAAAEGSALYVFGSNATTYVNNNTMGANVCTAQNETSATLSRGGSSDVFVSNNIMWNNVGETQADLSAAGMVLIANDIQRISGVPAAPSTSNVSVDPQFVALGDYRLLDTSPLVDIGANPPIGGATTLDLQGQRRVAGRIDLGAYETDRLFRGGFEN